MAYDQDEEERFSPQLSKVLKEAIEGAIARDGTVRVFVSGADGRPDLLGILKDGEFVQDEMPEKDADIVGFPKP